MNSGPMFSPEEAIQQVKQTLSSYIVENPDPDKGWKLKAEAGLAAFTAAFPSDKKHSLDAIKKHVLELLAPTFVHFGKWLLWLPGASKLREDLENKANSWPSQQAYLEYALEQAQKALGQIQPQPVAATSDAVDDDKVAELEAKLENLRLVNVALISRLKEQAAASSSVPDTAAVNDVVTPKATPKRAAKK